MTARGPTRRTDATAGGGSGPRSSPPPCSRTMSQPGDGPWFVPARSYVSSERPQTTPCRDAVLAWPSSSRLPVEPTAPAATPAWARWVEASSICSCAASSGLGIVVTDPFGGTSAYTTAKV